MTIDQKSLIMINYLWSWTGSVIIASSLINDRWSWSTCDLPDDNSKSCWVYFGVMFGVISKGLLKHMRIHGYSFQRVFRILENPAKKALNEDNWESFKISLAHLLKKQRPSFYAWWRWVVGGWLREVVVGWVDETSWNESLPRRNRRGAGRGGMKL